MNFLELRNRSVLRTRPTDNSTFSLTSGYPNRTSTPEQSPQVENIRRSIQETSNFLRSISEQVSNGNFIPNLTSLFDDISEISSISQNMNQSAYNKEMAEIMATNIPKFELNSNTNLALELRSFIKACENVLKLFETEEDESYKREFFRLITFRLGYNVQERITKNKFENLKDLENHLRSICHIKLDKGKLLNEIRHERQRYNENVSDFIERLRKLIAQGRSEYNNDREFEREAIHTLKNSIKNELISIKLMDSNSDKFEELAEIALNRDIELHQRSYNTKHIAESNKQQETINELIQKIKDLEAKQAATINNLRREQNRSKSPIKFNNSYQERDHLFCSYCKRKGHLIKDCRQKRNQNQFSNQNPQNKFYNRNQATYRPAFSSQNYQNQKYRNNSPSRFNNTFNNHPANSFRRVHFENPSNNYKSQNLTCLRCNKRGHKSNNCYELICSICKNMGHIHTECKQNSYRRVHATTTNYSENSQGPTISEISNQGNGLGSAI